MEIQRIIDRFVTDIGGPDLSRRFEGVVNPETVTSLGMTNDPVIFVEPFRAGFARLPLWALPTDQPGRGGQPSMPVKDARTPVPVAVLLRLLPDHCLTKKAHEQNAVVTVPTIDNSQVLRPAATLTAPDLLRVFVFEVAEPGQSKITALAVRQKLLLFPGEIWMPAALRTLMHTRAASVQYYKPHAMEGTYYWRTVAGDQLQDHCVRIISVLNPSDTNPFHPVLFNLRTAIRNDLNRRAHNEGQLLSDKMVAQGIAAPTIYGNFLSEISHLSHLYAPTLTGDPQPSSLPRTPTRSPRQRFSAVASDQQSRRLNSAMHDIWGARPAAAPSTAAATHPYHPPNGKRKRTFSDRVSAIISAIKSEFSDDDFQDPSPENPNDNTDNQDQDMQDVADDLSAFANKPASRPGKFGTPFIDGSSHPRNRPRLSGPTQPTSAAGRRHTFSTRMPPSSAPPATVPTSTTPAPVTTTTSTPGKEPLPTRDAPSDVIHRELMTRRVCFYYAYGISCAHNPCKYLHEESDIPYA